MSVPKLETMFDGHTTMLCRLMHPNDANIAGNVHGGTILKMIEEAGLIISTRHCNIGAQEECLCVLARVEKTDFLLPMYVGEVAHLTAAITYCSQHSVEVQVSVVGENIATGRKRTTNRATLWYVPCNKGGKIAVVPPIIYPSQEVEAKGRNRYERQKTHRQNADTNSPSMRDGWAMSKEIPHPQGGEMHTVENASSALIHLVGVGDCGVHGKVTGGVTMKLMDEVAGICAFRHCHSNVVTASMDATDFHRSISKGSILHIKSRPIFNSAKSLMIQVVVIVEERARDKEGRIEASMFCACSAFFTYVSLTKEGKPQTIPPLKLLTVEERERFEEGKCRYLKDKELRRSNM
uniref:Cytosolic acyl coenzyme A thioester hydrolase n=1 Tax=Phallusia mammillata TaxID=59560 RepID=A0A6F9D5H3_9ASCI|nr:cytosolic acyl coenzyme A thioester hydrolase [Phallusia mammillata]